MPCLFESTSGMSKNSQRYFKLSKAGISYRSLKIIFLPYTREVPYTQFCPPVIRGQGGIPIPIPIPMSYPKVKISVFLKKFLLLTPTLSRFLVPPSLRFFRCPRMPPSAWVLGRARVVPGFSVVSSSSPPVPSVGFGAFFVASEGSPSSFLVAPVPPPSPGGRGLEEPPLAGGCGDMGRVCKARKNCFAANIHLFHFCLCMAKPKLVELSACFPDYIFLFLLKSKLNFDLVLKHNLEVFDFFCTIFITQQNLYFKPILNHLF